jgi:hypothetical protein
VFACTVANFESHKVQSRVEKGGNRERIHQQDMKRNYDSNTYQSGECRSGVLVVGRFWCLCLTEAMLPMCLRIFCNNNEPQALHIGTDVLWSVDLVWVSDAGIGE